MTSTKKGTVGILGVGHLMRHMVPGLLRSDTPPRLLLSPRSNAVVQELTSRYTLSIATNSKELVDRSNTIIIALRPLQVADAIAGLPWRSEQQILSVCAGVAVEEFARHVNGADVVRSMPVTAAEFGESPTCIFPDANWARFLLTPCGPVFALDFEEQFEAASVFGAAYGWYQALGAEMTEWLLAQGLEPLLARSLANHMMRASATTMCERKDVAPKELVDELISPGSITGHGLEILKSQNAYEPWRTACSSALARLLTKK